MFRFWFLPAQLGPQSSFFRALRPLEYEADRRQAFAKLFLFVQTLAEWKRQRVGTIRRFAPARRIRSEATTTRISIGSSQVAGWIIGGADEVGIMRWQSLELCMQVCVGKRCTCTTNLGCPTDFLGTTNSILVRCCSFLLASGAIDGCKRKPNGLSRQATATLPAVIPGACASRKGCVLQSHSATQISSF